MSMFVRVIGTIITLIGGISMYLISMNSANETIEAGRILPTPEQFWDNVEGMVGSAIVMFIGFGIISLGWWFCRRS